MSHIRTVSSAKLSEADREKQISLIKRENSNIFQNLTLLEGEEKVLITTKTQQIRHLANNYERLHELGDYNEPINHICATIIRLCAEKKLIASSQLARYVLPDKFKQTEFTSHNNLSSNNNNNNNGQVVETQENAAAAAVFDDAVPNEEKNDFHMVDYRIADLLNSSSAMAPGQEVFVDPTTSDTLLAVDKPPSQMTRDEIRQVAEARIARTRKSREALLEDRRREREILEECDKRKIALSPEFEHLAADHISAKSPDTGPSPAWESCIRLIKSYEKLADKLYRWRPPKHIQQDMVEAFEADIEFLEPFLDEKYRKCQAAWWVVQLNNIWHGKHAAAIMSSTPIDEKLKRALTREQVGDRYEEDLKRAVRFSGAIKKWAILWKWFVEMNEKGIATRAKELGPTLSDKAFS